MVLYPRHPQWEGLSAIVEVTLTVEKSGKPTPTTYRRYYISSLAMSAHQAATYAIRSHWGIENKLHWVLDVIFNEKIRPESVPGIAQKTWPLSGISLPIYCAGFRVKPV